MKSVVIHILRSTSTFVNALESGRVENFGIEYQGTAKCTSIVKRNCTLFSREKLLRKY
jgi:hypothetical protein